MPYKNKADRMKRQQSRRDTPTTIDTPEADTPVELIPRIDTPTNSQLAEISSIFWTAEGRQKLLDILAAFKDSHHPEYMEDVRLGVFGHSLDYISKL